MSEDVSVVRKTEGGRNGDKKPVEEPEATVGLKPLNPDILTFSFVLSHNSFTHDAVGHIQNVVSLGPIGEFCI